MGGGGGSNRSVLIESQDTWEKWISCLTGINHLRKKGGNIAYVDKSYILFLHVNNKSCLMTAIMAYWHTCTHRTAQTQHKCTDIHVSRGNRTHDPSVWVGKDSSCLRPCIQNKPQDPNSHTHTHTHIHTHTTLQETQMHTSTTTYKDIIHI
jgi:hypothetical protein